MEGKKSVADLRAELKFLREQSKEHTPVSKLKKSDISEMIGMLKAKTMTTPAAGQMKKTTDLMAPVVKSNKKAPKAHDGYTEVEEEVKVKKIKPPTMEHKMKAEQAEKKKITMKERMAALRAMKK